MPNATVTITKKSSAKERVQSMLLNRSEVSLFPSQTEVGKSMLESILVSKAYGTVDDSSATRQGRTQGKKWHPFDRSKVKNMLVLNEHHSTCIHTKVNACVGLGHLTVEERMAKEALVAGDPTKAALLRAAMGTISRVDEVLDPLCEHSWLETLSDVAQDFYQVGEGALEVVRAGGAGAPITGLHHIPAEDISVYIEPNGYDRHYVIESYEDSSALRRFANFGDLEDFERRHGDASDMAMSFHDPATQRGRSEVIHFRKPTSLSKWYGYPDWLAAVASIELMQKLRQWKYDFFNNRGVPEFMLFILGQKLSDDEWETIEKALNANIGAGNSHKSLAMNLDNPDIEIQLEKLAMDNKGEDTFDNTSNTLATSVVTAHRVPPLLAGIQIPGKLGASNEMVNALVSFQTLVIGQDQSIFQRTLGNTLGNQALNGGLALTSDDFELRKITDAYDLQSMDTVSRMRQSVPEANAEGRDMSEGVKKVELAKEALKIAEERKQTELAGLLSEFIERQEAA